MQKFTNMFFNLFRKKATTKQKDMAQQFTHAAVQPIASSKGGILGAIIGDMAGSRFEFHNAKSTNIKLLTAADDFTDDTVMTIAVADWLIQGGSLAKLMRDWGRRYPHRGYGGKFNRWLVAPQERPPYNSFGNGAGMRVSPCGYIAKTLDEALELAKQSAEVTHNHPEGVKGAQAIATAIFLARQHTPKPQIRQYVERTFGYDLQRTCDDIRPTYKFDETCQGSCPEAIIAFLDSTDYESAIRLAISLGGDSDTIACMTGGIAAAYYGIPDWIVEKAVKYLPAEMIDVINRFDGRNLKNDMYKMKAYLLILVAIFPIIVMGQPAMPLDSKTPIRVTLKYDRPIGGYEVTALWQPFEAKNSETGCITATFRNAATGMVFKYVNNEKFSSYHTDCITFSEGFEGYKDGDEYTIKYISPDSPNLPYKPIDYYLPFQFYDVDFDGKDELLVRDWGGSRNGDCSVYEVTNKGLKEKSYFPFGQIDAQTEFDGVQKTIKLCAEDGAWSYYEVICKKRPRVEAQQLIVPTDIDPTLQEILADITARTTVSDFHIVSASVRLDEKEYELFVAHDRWNLKCSKSHIK